MVKTAFLPTFALNTEPRRGITQNPLRFSKIFDQKFLRILSS